MKPIDELESSLSDPADAGNFVRLAHSYREAGEHEIALAVLRTGLETHVTFLPGYVLLGQILMEQRRLSEARFTFERVLEIDAENVDARVSIDIINARLMEARSARQRQRPPQADGEAEPTFVSSDVVPQATQVTSKALFSDDAFALIPQDIDELYMTQDFERSSPSEPDALRATGPRTTVREPDAFQAAGPRTNLSESDRSPPSEPERTSPHEPDVGLRAAATQTTESEYSTLSEVEGRWDGGSAQSAHPAGPEARATRNDVERAIPGETDVDRAAHAEARSQQSALAETTTVALADLLVGLLEYRDPHFRGGTSLTRLLAAAIGRELGLTQEEVSAIELGVVLRDLGLVPLKDLISRPGTELTVDERDRISGHIDTTLNLLAPLDLPAMARDVIRYHHERWDGTGYPEGLVGKATPIAGRIAGVADSFAARISARPHRLPRRPPAAFEEISRLGGKQYDPTVVNALERTLDGADWRGVRFGLRHHILIIDSDDSRGVALAVKLCSHGYLAEAVDLATAHDRFEHSKLSGIIISAEIGESEIRQLVSEVRNSARLAMLPVVVTDAGSPSRVALLEAGADVCLPRGSSFEELRATLGAFLRREDKSALNTRRRGEPPPWSGLQGDVRDFPLNWLLQMLNYDGRTAALFVDSDSGDEGVIYLQGGQPRHAQTKSLVGDDALRLMLTWEKGSFRIGPEVKTEKQTIELPLMKLLLDQATQDDHAAFFGAVQV